LGNYLVLALDMVILVLQTMQAIESDLDYDSDALPDNGDINYVTHFFMTFDKIITKREK